MVIHNIKKYLVKYIVKPITAHSSRSELHACKQLMSNVLNLIPHACGLPFKYANIELSIFSNDSIAFFFIVLAMQ